jgi:hypothetical protein
MTAPAFARPRMRRQVSVILVLAAWLLATGSQWDLAQTFAWGRMITNYSSSMSLAQAVKKTFGGEMCSLCRAVQQAKQQQEADSAKTTEGKVPGKILLVSVPATPIFLSPASSCVGLTAAVSAPLSAERSAPPSPPPRALA